MEKQNSVIEPSSSEENSAPEVSEPAVIDDQPVAEQQPSILAKLSLKLHHNFKWLLVFPCLLLILLIISLLISNKFMHFKLGRQLIAADTPNSAIEKIINSYISNYRLTLDYPNGSPKNYSLSSMGVAVNEPATLQSLRQDQARLGDKLLWWKAIPVKLAFQTNQAAFTKFIASNVNYVAQPAENASLSIQNGQVQLANAVEGKQYSLANAASLISSHIVNLNDSPLKLQVISLSPSLTNADLGSTASSLQATIDQKISISVGNQVVSPPKSVIASWIELSPNIAAKSVSVAVNSSNVKSYLDSLASSNSTVEKDQVNITNADGTTTTLEPGVAGTNVGPTQDNINTISSNLLSNKGIQVSLAASTIPYGTITAGNWSKWIEVDITTKRLYAYQYGQLMKTFLVSAGAPSTPTPTGEFHIWEKLVSQTMSGPGYVQPNVPWVNYFNNSGDAIHGNYWRPASYFGNINSSHGCVGLMDSDALWVYDWAPIGTAVIIHA